MSVLETFYILFKSDADKAAEGLDKVEDAADGAERSLQSADKATKAIKGSAREAATATGTLATTTATADANARRLAASFMAVAKTIAAPLIALASVNGVFNAVTGRAENIRELDRFSAKLNSSIGDVDAFQRAIQSAGGEGSKALDSLVKVGEKFNEAFSDKDSGARKDFEAWGLSFKDAQGNALGATEAMLALAESVEGLSRAEALARIKKLGIEDATSIELILKGREAMEHSIETQKKMGVVTEEQAQVTREYYDALGSLGNQLTSVGNNMVSAFLPGLTGGLDILSKGLAWIVDNQTLVEGFFIAVGSAISIYFLPAIISATLWLLGFLAIPILIVAALALLGAAFALAYEDFQAWANGQPSVLGELLGDYKTFVASLQGLFDAFSWDNFLLDLQNIKNWFSDFFSIDGFLQDVESIKAAFTGLGKWVGDTLGAAVENVINLIKGIPAAIQAAVVAIPLALSGMGDGPPSQNSPAAQLGAAFGAAAAPQQPYADGNGPSWVRKGQVMLNDANNAPQGLAAPSKGPTTNTVTIDKVEINTQATDAAGIARAVRSELSNELRGAAAAFDDGVVK